MLNSREELSFLELMQMKLVMAERHVIYSVDVYLLVLAVCVALLMGEAHRLVGKTRGSHHWEALRTARVIEAMWGSRNNKVPRNSPVTACVLVVALPVLTTVLSITMAKHKCFGKSAEEVSASRTGPRTHLERLISCKSVLRQ